jgi:FkbM family methyltransferase
MSPELGPLLAEDVGRATEREKTYFDRAFASANGQVVLFGAGGLGRKALIGLRRVGIEPLAFADNDPERWGQVIGGLPVLAPGEAAGAYGGAALFLLTIWRPFGFDAPATLRQLRELGCRAVLPFAGLAWRYPEVFLPHPGIDLPRGVVEQAEDVRRAADLWADEPSRDEYVAQLAWRLTLDVTGLRPPDDEPQYFPRDLLRVSQDETFVDGGAFDGDTIRSLLGQRDDFAGCVVAIEPDPFSYAGLRRFVDGLPQHCRTRIVTLPLAVSDRRERLPFDATGTVSSAVRTDGEGSCAVDAAPLDEILAEVDPDLVPTFIKLDVEGAELAALAGARALIVRHRPILAVCAYHQQDHLWKVPLRLRGLGPDYRLYLRRYGNTIWDLVCYAIPPGRLVGSLSC